MVNISTSLTRCKYFLPAKWYFMIIFRLPILLAEKKLRVADVARATKLSKTTLHKLYNEESKRIDFETIDKLCSFLNCQVSDLFEYREDDDASATGNDSVTT